MSAEVYRLKVGIALSGSGGTGEWRYFEDRDDLAAELLDAHVDMIGSSRSGQRSRRARIWRRLRTKETYPRVSNVFAVERHTDAGWVDVPYEVIEPAIAWGDALSEKAGQQPTPTTTERSEI